MVPALSKNNGNARRRARSSHSFLSRALGKGLRAMAREYSRLVHQPPGLVGPPHTGMVPESGKRKPKTGKQKHSRADRIAGRRMEARRGHARHLVFVLALGL